MKCNADQISKSIYENPSCWTADGRIFVNEKAGIRIWVDPMILMCGPTPFSTPFHFSFFGKIRFMRAFRWWERRNIGRLLNIESEEKS